MFISCGATELRARNFLEYLLVQIYAYFSSSINLAHKITF